MDLTGSVEGHIGDGGADSGDLVQEKEVSWSSLRFEDLLAMLQQPVEIQLSSFKGRSKRTSQFSRAS